MDEYINTVEKRKVTLESLMNLRDTVGYQYIKATLSQYIDLLRSQLENPYTESTPLEDMKIKLHIQVLKYYLDLPEIMIQQLDSKANEGFDFSDLDPFDRTKFIKSKKEQNGEQ